MLLRGTPIKQHIRAELAQKVSQSISQGLPIPVLAIIMVGDNPRSEVYVQQKKKFGQSVGIQVDVHTFPTSTTAENLANEVQRISSLGSVHGVILQMPLPTHFSSEDVRRIIDLVPPLKDVDGLTTLNMGALATGLTGNHIPATTRGILELCAHYQIKCAGKHVVVIGRSNLVGKPTALSMLQAGATVTICHSQTVQLAEIVQTADIVISATGIPKLITKDMVREGQYIIDVGISINGAGQVSGDVDTEAVEPIVAGVSPVPGGVGPLTVSGLFKNVLDAYLSQSR